jgi:hypothetical protein
MQACQKHIESFGLFNIIQSVLDRSLKVFQIESFVGEAWLDENIF